MTSSLVPVKPWDDSLTVRSTMEVEEFSQSFPEAAHPHTAYVNNLYVYPLSLNYSNQKVFSKVKKKKEEEENCISVGWSQNKCFFFPLALQARNISVKIEFRDSDDENAKPLQV